eukprot:2188351-Pyramimonas_sp.AAC.1
MRRWRGISKFAVCRGLPSGGNLDKLSYVDLGNKDVQVAAMHWSGACVAKAVALQPNCETTGPPSFFNAKINDATWYEHHKRRPSTHQ